MYMKISSVIKATIIVVMVARIVITMVRMICVICATVRLRTGCHGCGSRFTILSLACASASATWETSGADPNNTGKVSADGV